MPDFAQRRKSFKERINKKKAFVIPGCGNALTGKLIEEAGFEALFISGSAVANIQLGFPDLGLTTMTEIVTQVRYICNATRDIPVFVDADTGYGNELNVVRTVKELEQAGASAIMLEDQVFPKKCGHFSGKEVIEKEEMVNKLHAAIDARDDDNTVIIARTDSLAIHGINHALDRAQAYIEAGADVTFVEAPRTLEEMQLIGKLPAPQLVNMVEGGLTPLQSLQDLDKIGFTIVLYANTAMRASILAIQKAMSYLNEKGDTFGIHDQIVTWEERQRIVGLEELEEYRKKYGG